MKILAFVMMFAALSGASSAIACEVRPRPAPEGSTSIADVVMRAGERCVLLDWGAHESAWQPLGPSKGVITQGGLGDAVIMEARKPGPTGDRRRLVYRAHKKASGTDTVEFQSILPYRTVFEITITR